MPRGTAKKEVCGLLLASESKTGDRAGQAVRQPLVMRGRRTRGTVVKYVFLLSNFEASACLSFQNMQVRVGSVVQLYQHPK